MKDFYDIAVVGESMAGKSTWIANLFTESITKKLKEICTFNKEGQTKIAVYYRLEDTNLDIFKINSIGWNLDMLIKEISNKKKQGIIIELFEKLKLFDEVEHAQDVSDDMAQKLEKYFKSETYVEVLNNTDVLDFISKFANDSVIGETGIITFIEISATSRNNVWDIIKKYNLKSIRIRDTRGFLDETEDKMQEYLENVKNNRKDETDTVNTGYIESDKKEEYLQKLLDERGIHGIDACIFMSIANSNALCKKTSRAIYGPLIKNLLDKHPTYLVVRADKLTEVLTCNSNLTYKEAISKNDDNNFTHLTKFFTGFNDLRNLLIDYGLNEETNNFDSSDYKTGIAKRHYKELVLPNIIPNLNDEGEKQLQEDVYLKSVLGVFEDILEGIHEYYNNINSANELLEKLHNVDYIQSQFCKLFNQKFNENIFFHGNYWGYSNKLLYYVTQVYSNKVQGPYYGGMVGVNGGLTTYIAGEGRVGQYAASLLQTAYNINRNLNKEFIESLDEDLKKLVISAKVNELDIDEKIKLLKQNLHLKFEKEVDSSFEYLETFGSRMIPRWHLHKAYKKTRTNLEVSQNRIGRYLKDLEYFDGNERWLQDRHQMSVVKDILWQIIVFYRASLK